MPDRYLIFADGGDEKGFGHLSRMKTLVSNLDIKDQSVVLYETQGQKSFWKENNFLHAYPKNEISKFLKHQEYFFFIDSKLDRSDLVESFKSFSNKIIVIDNHTTLAEKVDIQINPIFYIEDNNISNLSSIKRIIGSGLKYCIIDKKFLLPHSQIKKTKLTLSFGGRDPNNITLKCLKLLSSNKDIIQDLLIIIGPGYPHDINELYKFCNKDQIEVNPENIDKFFKQSYLVLTALGVTVQELFCLGTPMGIVHNYDYDEIDIKNIYRFSKELRPNDQLISSFGSYENINYLKMHKEIVYRKSSTIISKPLMQAGEGWKTFLKDINN